MEDTSRISDSDEELVQMASLQSGTIFWSALAHPYHENTHRRLYLVVSSQKPSSLIKLAIVGLETNGGHGRGCYAPEAQQFIKEVVTYEEKLEEDSAAQSLCISEIHSYALKLKNNTVVDLTTVLTVQSSNNKLECTKVGRLTANSMHKVWNCFESLADLQEYHKLMITRTPKRYPDDATPQHKGLPVMTTRNPAEVEVEIFDPQYSTGYWGLRSLQDLARVKQEKKVIGSPGITSSDEEENIAKRVASGSSQNGYRYVGRPKTGWNWEPKE